MITKKRGTLIILFLFLIISIMSCFNVVSGNEGHLSLNIKKERKLGYSYKLNDRTGKDIWKIYDTENDQYDTIYCLKGGPGFGSSDMSSGTSTTVYSKYFDMRKPNTPDMPSDYRSKLPQGDDYNKLMWVLDHCYVLPKKDPSSDENTRAQENRKILLDAVKTYIEESGLVGITIDRLEDIDLLTDDDIDAVQQLAIWYYTNSADDYHVEDFTLYLSQNGMDMYSPLEQETMGNPLFPNGPQRAKACTALFDYFIDTSEEEGTSYNYSAVTSAGQSLTLANTNVTMDLVGSKYVIGPYRIEGTIATDYTLTGKVTDGSRQLEAGEVTYLASKSSSVGTDLKKLVGRDFYISIPSTANVSQITFEISGAYYQTEVNYWSVANPKNTDQPVVKIEKVRKTFSASKVFVPATGEYEIELEKVDSRNTDKKLPGATFSVSIDGAGATSHTTDASGKFTIPNIPIKSEGTQKITITETSAPTGYSNQKATITLTVTTELKNGAYAVKSISSSGTISRGPSGSTELKDLTVTQEGNKIKIQMKNYQLDLALRKFIISIAGKEVRNNGGSGPYTREPQISQTEITKLSTNTASLDGGTTAQKVHPKDALEVHTGDKVIYVIRVYNEGEIPAYAKKVADYLPEGLKFIPQNQSSINQQYGWTNPNGDGRTIETDYLQNDLIDAFNGSKIAYKDLKVECEVIAKPGATELELKNIAEITKHSDEYGDETVLDRDSQPKNVTTQNYRDQSQQDDDDFERLRLKSASGGYEIELEKVDSRNTNTKLQGAIFEVSVNGGNKISYTTNTYGKLSIPNIPITTAGTQTITIRETKAPTGYSKNPDTITLIVTTALENGEYIVKSISMQNGTIAEGTGVTSVQGLTITHTNNKISMQMKNYKLDFALRKFIISIADKEIRGDSGAYAREPVITQDELSKLASGTASLDNGTTALKSHPKNELEVHTGDKVIYTIRVYNEGEIAGYVKKVTDYLPEGLKFIPQDQSTINQQFEWTNTNGDGRTIETEHLKNDLLNAFNGSNLDYRDLKIECEVIAKPGVNSTVLKNIAEITAQTDKYNDSSVLDVDSTPNNVRRDTYAEQSQQDDDDFERLILQKATGSYEIELEKVDSRNTNTKLQGATFEVTIDGGKTSYTTGTDGKISVKNIPIESAGTKTVTIKETKAPTGYSNQGATITLSVNTALEDGKYVVKTIQSSGTIEQGPSGSTTLKGFTATLVGNKIQIQMKNYKLDLALRKFIISIAGEEVKTGENYTREPQISQTEITGLASGSASLDNGTTAKKEHPKNPLTVKTGDRVIYVIRVYNEGEIAGYAKKVTDYLPAGLKFVPQDQSTTNRDFGWTNPNNDGRTIQTEYLKDQLLNAFNGTTIAYKDLKIECEVTAVPGESAIELKNIAEITKQSDEYNDETVKDIDSEPGNVRTEDYEEQSQQDDDDFERLVLPQATGKYELELEKVDSRNTNTKLEGATFTVTINGENETPYTTDGQGKINVTDIPIRQAGTQTISIKETKAPTGYSNQGAVMNLTVTTALENGVYIVKNVTGTGNITQGPSGSNTLNGVSVTFENNKIKIQMKNYKLDLALRKFIISVAGEELRGENEAYAREPVISQEELNKLANGSASLDDGTTALKTHSKDPVPVKTGDRVIYIIRVYNEGEIPAYAKKVTDYLPAGLKFVTDSTINNDFGWSNPTNDGRTIQTEYLKDKLLNAFDGHTLDYKDLKVECEVIAKPGATKTELKNIAEITKHSDEYGNETVKDRDSEPGNVTTENYGEQSQQDDDDFERLVLPKATGYYELELEKVDSKNTNKKLQGATFEVTINGGSKNTYTTNEQGIIDIKNILIEDEGVQTVVIKETKAPTGYSNQGATITLKITTALEDGKYVVKNMTSSGVITQGASGSTELKGFTATLAGNKISMQMKNYKLDLALRKFIISVAGEEPKTEAEVKTVSTTYKREPNISEEEISGLANGTASKDNGTTANKVHTKEPVMVETGDRVIYIIRVYNEGEIAGYAKKVTDYLPEGLKFVPQSESSINQEYGWTNPSEDGRTIETEYLSDKLLNAFDGQNLDYKDLKIECEVTALPGESATMLKNIAEITKHSDEYNDETVEDRDSEPDNVNEETYGEESQQDDDDFERLILAKATGNYNLKLEKVDGHNTDNLTNKLQNAEYEVQLPDGTTNKYTTNEQGVININELPIEETGEQTIIIKETKAPEGFSRNTDIIVIKVQTVLENGKYVAKVVSVKEQSEDDSKKVNLTGDLQELTLGKTDAKANLVAGTIYLQMKNYKIDLALRKFIISNAGEELKEEDGSYSREPVITDEELEKLKNGIASLDDGSTALKTHTKEPVTVKTGNRVIYVIRVYNEGKIAGYASEVADYLPEGLKFVTDSEINREYGWKMYKENGEETSNAEEAKYIKTKYLSKENEKEEGANLLEPFYKNGRTTLDYRDLKVECEVVAEAGEVDKTLRNIAEITDDRDKNNEPVDDVDSVPDDVDKDNYKDESQEDDDDFEDLVLEKAKDGVYNLELQKVNGHNVEEKLAGAEFEITLPNGAIKKYTTEEDGKIVISNLPITKLEVQTITIKETKAPEGFSRNTDTIVVKVQTGIKNAVYVADIVSIIKEENTETNDQNTEENNENTEAKGENIEVNVTDTLEDVTIGKTDLSVKAEDGNIFIQVKDYMLDLALRKFITKVNDRDITNRAPVFTKVSDTEFKYEHPKDPVEVANANTVIYTLRIFNEGKIAGYANKIKDDLPSGLLFLPEHETNIEYRWKMYNKDGEETENVEEAEYIETDYLAKENEKEEGANLLKAFDQETMTMPDYRDVKIAFKVTEPNTSDRIIINTAEITDDRDENNEPVDDIDSTPDNDDDDEDDIDEEKIKVKYFDLSLKKWVSESIVTYNGKTTVTKTGHTGDENPEPPAKVELKEKDLSKTTVKFKFIIKVTNEGDIAGYATELEDYIPEGLKFLAEDNPKWREEDGRVVTDQLKDTLLQPGESAEVEIILTWVNGKNNLGEKVNWAEISKDYNDEGSPDIDSTPGNKEKDEDDIDNAPVILSIVTGISPTYIGLILAVVAIMACGVVLIKKFVMEN